MLTEGAGRFFAAATPCLPADCVGLDGRISGWIGVTPNSLGQCCFVCGPLSFLFGQVPRSVAFEIFPASLFVAHDLGSTSRFANRSDQSGYSVRSGCYCNRIDDLCVEQQSPMDS